MSNERQRVLSVLTGITLPLDANQDDDDVKGKSEPFSNGVVSLCFSGIPQGVERYGRGIGCEGLIRRRIQD